MAFLVAGPFFFSFIFTPAKNFEFITFSFSFSAFAVLTTSLILNFGSFITSTNPVEKLYIEKEILFVFTW